MIDLQKFNEKNLEFVLFSMSQESTEGRAFVDRDYDAILKDAHKIAEFLQVLFPEDDIIIFDRTFHITLNKDGTFFTMDIFPKNNSSCAMWLTWNPSTKQTLISMNVRGRTLLSKQLLLKF